MKTHDGGARKAPDNRPRLFVVVPLILVCLTVACLIIRESLGLAPGEGNPSVAGVATNGPQVQTSSSRTRLTHDRQLLLATRRTTRLVTSGAVDVAVNPNESPEASDTSARDRLALEPAADTAKTLEESSIIVASNGSITGRIFLQGTPPAEKDLPINPTDPTCGKLHTTIPKTRFYVVSTDGGLADTVVYIKEGLGAKKFDPPAAPVILDQKGCEYVPYVFAVQAKQRILIKNSDPFLHNVNFSPSKDIENRSQNMAQMGGSRDLERAFDKQPELLVRFQCNIHPWMFAYAAVLDHPYFAVSDSDGTFNIINVPPGKYVIEAYHRKAGIASQPVTVGRGENKRVNFTLQVSTGS